MRRVLVGIFVAGLMVVMTASPGSACEPVTWPVEDDEGDQNKMYDAETLYPMCQWSDGTPIGSADYLDVRYVELTLHSTGEVTAKMELNGLITASTELPSGVKEVNWVIGAYHEPEPHEWFVDSYAVAFNWAGGDMLEATWVDLNYPDGPLEITPLVDQNIDLDEAGVDTITVSLDESQSDSFAECQYWIYGIRIYLNQENGGGRTNGWFWVDIPDPEWYVDDGNMAYPWYVEPL